MTPAERISLLADLQRAASNARASEAQLRRDVAEARQRGLSWRDVGNALGVSGQAAHKRFRSTRVALQDRRGSARPAVPPRGRAEPLG